MLRKYALSSARSRGAQSSDTRSLLQRLNMMSIAARSGVFSPYMQATAFAVAGPLKALVPGVVVKGENILLNPKKQFLCRESLNGQSPKTGPAVTVSINGKLSLKFSII